MRKSAPRAQSVSVSDNADVYVAGFLSTASGLGYSARLHIQDLQRQGRQACGINVGPSMLQLSDLPCPPNTLSPDKDLPQGAGLVVVHVNAPFMAWVNHILGARFLAGKRIIGYWAWELPQVPQDWLDGFDYVDEVWVPSCFVRDALIEHTCKPIKVVPHCLPPTQCSLRTFAEDGVVRVLSILNMASGFSRKNPLGAIKAFQQAFGRNDKFQLLIKLVNTKAFRSGLEAIKQAISGWPNIQLIDAVLSGEEVQALYDQSDIYLSLHRSEGFGLPLLEAMQKGLHVVATGWSGNVDFMVGPRCHLVPYVLVPAHDPQGTYDHGNMVWAEPDLAAAAQILRGVSKDALS
jgi:glycosyltransferase involved in cell wall biosynthesis